MLTRSCLLVVSTCIGCATAAEPEGGHATPDAGNHAGTVPDAAIVRDAGARLPDATSGAGACAYSGVLATWSFASAPGTQAATAAQTTAPGVTAASVGRAVGLTAVAGTSSMNSSDWPSSTQADPTKYYTLSLTPPSGCGLSLTSISLDLKASATGPTMAAVATSADGFTQGAAASTSSPSTPALAVTDASGSIELRIYGFAAGGANGTLRVQGTLAVTGSLQ